MAIWVAILLAGAWITVTLCWTLVDIRAEIKMLFWVIAATKIDLEPEQAKKFHEAIKEAKL